MQLRSAIHLELERFFDRAKEGWAGKVPVASAFTKARKKLRASAFIALNETLKQVFADHTVEERERITWRGLRMLATDGSTLRVPNTQEVIEYFGGMQPAQGDFAPMARTSLLYDVMTDVIIAGEITAYGVGEGCHLEEFLDKYVTANDCMILDRGYFDQLVPSLICAKGAHFIMRVGVGQWDRAREFVDSGEREQSVSLKVPLWVREEWKEEGTILAEEIACRLVRVELSTGEVEVLLTDLSDSQVYPAAEFERLYHKRWGVEEGFKNIKCKVEVENWTGKTVHSVQQDFHAAILMMNIAQTLAFFKNPEVAEETSSCEHDYKINVKRTIALIRDRMGELYNATAAKLQALLATIGTRIKKALTMIRPGRSHPRKPRPKRPLSPPYKPIA